MHTTIIRPGLLVSLKTTVRGGVSYAKRTIEEDRAIEGTNARTARWETERTIVDADEHARAIVARGKARTAVTRVCCSSSFGMLCPAANEAALQEAVAEAQAVADAHNSTAKTTRLDVFVITGRVADNDEQAARAIGSEVRDMLAAMEAGIKAADPAAIREAADKARAISGMLSEEAQGKVTKAIAEVRKIAREIVRRTGESGERAADVVAGVKLEALQAARFAVLDLSGESDPSPTGAAEMPVTAPAIDLAPMSEEAKPQAAEAPAFELPSGEPEAAAAPAPMAVAIDL